MRFVASLCHPSTLRMLICPEASSAQNSMAAVSADGSTVCVLILRLNSSCSRSIALVVRTLRHWLGGRRAKLIRRECVDHIIVLDEMHLRRVLKSYADYYNSVRTHRSLNKDAPVTRQIQ